MSIFKDSSRWWELPDEEVGRAVAAKGARLWTIDLPRRNEIETNLKRFGGKTLRGLFNGQPVFLDKKNLRLNLTKSVTETLTAKVGKNRPRPFVLTDGGDWALRQRGRKLQKYLDGVYQQAEVYAKTPSVFRDALLFGTGVMHFFPLLGKMEVGVERVFPAEMLVDPVSAINGAPRELFRKKYLDRSVVQRMFPKKLDVVEAAGTVPIDEAPYVEGEEGLSTMICVYEGWFLADYAANGDRVDGRHVIATDAGTLFAEDYEFDYFPFEFFHWTPPVLGFWGDPAVSEIRGLEEEVNKLLQSVQSAMKRAGMPWALVPNSAKVRTEKLTNEAGLIVRYEGQTAPQIVAFQPVHPQVLEQLWTLYGKAYEILGTNENQASGTKPPGIDSGRALEQLSEDHLVRFDHVSKHFEDLVGRRFARQILRVAEELDEHSKRMKKGGYVLRAVDNKTTLKIAWSEAKVSPDDFFLQTFPTSVLPHLPSGRTQVVSEWQANGWISGPQAQRLLDFPDIDSAGSVATADQDLLDWQIEQMVEDGQDVVPEPRQNLQTALQWGTYALERGMRDGTPEAHLDKLRTFLNAIDDMQKAAADEAQAALAAQNPTPGMGPPPGPPPGAPPAIPGAPAVTPGMPPA